MTNQIRQAFRWLVTVVRTFLDNKCAMHAASLTYYSLLAIVPALCVLLLVAKACGVDQFARDRLHGWFEAHVARFEATALPPPDAPAAPAADAGSADTRPEAPSPAAGAETDAPPPTAVPETPAVSPEEAERLEATRAFIDQARAIESGLMERIDSFNVGTLGWVGLLALVWTVIGSIGMVEVSFNEIWGVRRLRAFGRRLLLYLSLCFVLPVLSALALSVPLLKLVKDVIIATAGALWLTRWLSDGMVWLLDSWMLRMGVTLFFSTSVFAFLFKVLPNCRVPWRPAFWSGLVTALLFGAWLKLCAVAQVGIARSSALYGSFAFLPIVLAWLYMSWQVVLLGCCLVRATCLHARQPSPAAAG